VINRGLPLPPRPFRQPSRLAHAAIKTRNRSGSILYFVCPFE
jgi:hypothetical protein